MQPFISYLIVGIVFVLIGIFNIVKGSKMKSKCTQSTSARIVDIEKSYDTSDDDGPGGQYTYTPIFEFSANGTIIRKSGGLYSNNKRKYNIGDAAEVKYNPENPNEFIVNGKNARKSAGIPLMIFGVVMIVIAFTQI